jgi:4-alpha-glucanotransferase
MSAGTPERSAVRDALALLGIREAALALHDASLPMAPHEDIGRGSPASDEAARVFGTAHTLGFTAIQLGPQGETSAGNASPYDATAFSRGIDSLAWAPLVRGDDGPALVPAETLAAWVAARPPGSELRVRHAAVHTQQRHRIDAVQRRFCELLNGSDGPGVTEARALRARLARFTERHSAWLERYALYEALTEEHGCDHRSGWPTAGAGALDRKLWASDAGPAGDHRRAELRAYHAGRIAVYEFGQFLAHEQHEAVRRRAAGLGLRLLGDMQIGVSDRDHWAWPDAFLSDYRLGAPPSRTNPEGQPWGYPVLDPDRYGSADSIRSIRSTAGGVETGGSGENDESTPGAALALLRMRFAKLLSEFDGLRVDHPHGLVDPWVYRSDDPLPLRAVQNGARLFSSPNHPDHPALARYAIAGAGDLRASALRWADDWVAQLSPAQVDRYALPFDALIATAHAWNVGAEDIACEVLSTLPLPVAKVLERHGLGRFRVTQKATLDDPGDGYRSEHARPEDWIMIGTHDTPPIWQRVAQWARDGTAPARARRLAERLCADDRERPRLAEAFARDPGSLAQAYCAELFASPARHVLVSMTDLVGIDESYNAPGTISEANWSLRLPASWRRDYADRLARGRALSLPAAVAMALRARGSESSRTHAGLLARLDAEALAAPQRLHDG